MAKQTINIGASPNDGTGTPLRTAFDYTNQNFTELYTATGPSGNNIVVPGTATISGDLTVDTSTLKVDSANNRVGIGTASPADTLDVNGRVTALRYLSSSSNAALPSFAVSAGNGAYNSGTNEIGFSINSTSAMTLNATGLGVGTSPAVLLDIQSASAVIRATSSTGTNTSFAAFGNTGGAVRVGAENSAGGGLFTGSSAYSAVLGTTGAYSAHIGTNGVVRATVDATGNVGIGVTPSAWSGITALQISRGSFASDTGSYTLNQNVFNNGSNRYIATAAAMQFQAIPGTGFLWNIAPSGTAGNAITFTQAMTLDASGNLLVGTAAAGAKITALAGASGQAAIFEQPAQNFWCVLAHNQATSGDNSFVLFGTEASFTSRGSITYNRAGGLVAYNTTSDYRAKDIIGPVSNSGSLIDSLKVYVGKMKGATIERPMLIAHEAQEVAPYAVTGTKDEVDADGKPKYQQMDASALVPLLIAEIQSLRARVQTLEAK